MFVLLNHLQRLRRVIAAARASPARLARPAPRRCRLLQRLRTRADRRRQPLLRPAAIRPEHRGLPTPRRRPARHRRDHHPDGARAAQRLRSHAGATPGGRARELRTRLQPARGRREHRRSARGAHARRPAHPGLPAHPGRDRGRLDHGTGERSTRRSSASRANTWVVMRWTAARGPALIPAGRVHPDIAVPLGEAFDTQSP